MQRRIIDYIVVCINEFATTKKLSQQEAFRYLYANKGIDFLTENYDIEHTLSLQGTVSDLSMVCRNNGGMITIDILLNQMKYKQLTDQYSFHTNNALKLLNKGK